MLNKYTHQRILLCLLVKNQCKNLRRWAVLDDNNAVMTEHDHAEALKAEFNMKIKSDKFGFNNNLSIEVSTYDYHNKYHNDISNDGKVNMDFHSHYSDDSIQNADTIFEHMKNFIQCMYDNNLFIKDGIIYDTTDGCSKK